jgi:glycosyltransferase involved in cell wall biosynthesis
MRYLVVSSYPPMKCGIGKYAYQMVKGLRKNGNTVNVLSIEDGDGDFRENLKGWFNILKLFKYSFFYEKILIQYQEYFYYSDRGQFNRMATNLSYYLLFILLNKKIMLVAHEISYPRNRVNKMFERIKWFLCPKIVFHTNIEKENFERSFFKLPPGRSELLNPAEYYYKFRDITKKQARGELGIPEGCTVFLCIGFIQPHKGFDKAVKAFQGINNESMRLYIVGSLRLDNYIDYLNDLKKLVSDTPNTFLIEQYVTDELFDTWLMASDCVIVPYREIWSSGVAARAKLFNKPIIASNVGGLKDQLGGKDIIFNDDEELRIIIKEFSDMLGNMKGEIS